jgi:tetratricopeptide (TPR) repeat protein
VVKAALACGLVLGVAMTQARADVATPKDQATAAQANAEGTLHYELGEYSAALKAFQKAYLAYDAPAFLYNIARCHERLGERELAIERYGAFLSREPDSPDRASIEERIRVLRVEVEAARVAGLRHRPIYKRWWLWTTIGAVAVGAGLGVGLGLGLRKEAPSAHFTGVTAF